MDIKNLPYDDFLKYRPISRGTYARLESYIELLGKWQKTINLVAGDTLKEVWTRHIIDSSQLIEYISPESAIVDLGSGAGLPGLILAILGMKNTTLVESDRRKVAFLREAARITKTDIKIVNNRAEAIDLEEYNLIIARGLSPVLVLLQMLEHKLTCLHNMLLLKGKAYESEIREAQSEWSFDYAVYPSVTSDEGVILSLKNIQKKRFQ